MKTPTTEGPKSETPATNARERRRTGRRKGKIGRLPHAVREELNRRLLDGEAGGSLLAWLNGLPGAGDRRPITKQNLSEWRKGGWEDWVERQESRDWMGRMAEEAQATEAVAEGRRFSDLAANMAGLELGLLLQTVGRMEHGAEKTRTVLQVVHELVRLRTSERESEQAQRGMERIVAEGAEGSAGGGEGGEGVEFADVQGGPRKLSEIGARDAGDGGLTRGDTESGRKAPPTATASPGKLGGIKEKVENEGGLNSGEDGDGATRGVRAPRLQETDDAVAGSHREKSGLVGPARAGPGMAEGPEEIPSGATRFPFAPVGGAI